jgi:hypothetical protein
MGYAMAYYRWFTELRVEYHVEWSEKPRRLCADCYRAFDDLQTTKGLY